MLLVPCVTKTWRTDIEVLFFLCNDSEYLVLVLFFFGSSLFFFATSLACTVCFHQQAPPLPIRAAPQMPQHLILLVF
jgi:hypothetical protein